MISDILSNLWTKIPDQDMALDTEETHFMKKPTIDLILDTIVKPF